MAKTPREVIAPAFESHMLSGDYGDMQEAAAEATNEVMAALDRAGFVIVSKTALEAIAQSETILPPYYQYVAKIAKRELVAASTPTGEKG